MPTPPVETNSTLTISMVPNTPFYAGGQPVSNEVWRRWFQTVYQRLGGANGTVILASNVIAGPGINVSLSGSIITISNTGVRSIDVSGGTTGLTFAGGPITQTGVITMGGILDIKSGGTGATTAQQALNNLLPPAQYYPGQVLSNDGTNAQWNNISITGDVSGTGGINITTTLATVNTDVGTYGDDITVAQVTVNEKGLVTAVTNVPIDFPNPGEKTYTMNFSYGDVSPELIVSLPANKWVFEATISFTTAFNGTSPTISIGDSSNNQSVLGSNTNTPTQNGQTNSDIAVYFAAATDISLYINPGFGCSQGNGTVFLRVQT